MRSELLPTQPHYAFPGLYHPFTGAKAKMPRVDQSASPFGCHDTSVVTVAQPSGVLQYVCMECAYNGDGNSETRGSKGWRSHVGDWETGLDTHQGKFLTQLSSTGNDLPEPQDPLKAP